MLEQLCLLRNRCKIYETELLRMYLHLQQLNLMAYCSERRCVSQELLEQMIANHARH